MKVARWWNQRRFDLVEVGLLLFAVAAWGFVATQSAKQIRTSWLADRYGPERHSYTQEEWIIRDFFGDRRGGFFVDIGANDYERYSNTYYLDVRLGWSGIAVDPQRQFEAGYRTHRPRTRFLSFLVSDHSEKTATLFVGPNDLTASLSREYSKATGTIAVPTITLDDLLIRENVNRVDFLSIDVEFHEPQLLAGFNIDRFRPAFVCIEAEPQVRQSILEYFTRHRYVVVGKYLPADLVNLYFMPCSTCPRD